MVARGLGLERVNRLDTGSRRLPSLTIRPPAATCSPALVKRDSIHPWSGSSPSSPSQHLASPRWPLQEEWDK
jgi:hypothetical protein